MIVMMTVMAFLNMCFFPCFVGSGSNTGDKCISADEQSGRRKGGFK